MRARSVPASRCLTSKLLLASAFALAGCGGTSEPPLILPPEQLQVQPVVSGLASPLFLTAPAGDERLFVVEQPGRIRIVKNGSLLPSPFLDISGSVASGGEMGLLGLAFHPQYASNGYFYVNYTDLDGNTRVERYQVSSSPDLADPSTASLVLGVDQPYSNHNGGMLFFGADGMLYIALGDGGGGGDPDRNGQNLGVLLGKLLRIDVDHGTPYAIPSNNPFVGRAGARGEVWAYGLRNPWRVALDRIDGNMYVADVGQELWEEVNVVSASRGGVNYGWNLMEGNHCYGGASCDATPNLERAVLEYSHDDGCSITGGYVYRGQAIPGARGLYFYSDFCSGFLRSFRYTGGQAADQRVWDVGALGNVLSFGEDAHGELYILSANGTVFRIVAAQ